MDILERINKDMNSRPSEVTGWRATMHDARAEIERLRARPSVDDLAKIIDPEAFGLPDNVGDESDRDAARSRARLVLNALEQKEPPKNG